MLYDLKKHDYITHLDFTKNNLSVIVSNIELRKVVYNVLDNFDGVDIKTFYHSKYNDFVVYDYEPFCIDGFNIEISIEYNNINKLKYIEYLIINLLDKVIKCEKIYNLNVDLRSKDGIKIKELMEV